MACGTPRHSALASRLSAASRRPAPRLYRLAGRPAAPRAGDRQGDLRRCLARLRAARAQSRRCERADDHHAAVIVEVLSPATESYARGGNWLHYRLILSLQDAPRIERSRRLPTGAWEYQVTTEVTTEGTVELAAGVLLALRRRYDDLPA